MNVVVCVHAVGFGWAVRCSSECVLTCMPYGMRADAAVAPSATTAPATVAPATAAPASTAAPAATVAPATAAQVCIRVVVRNLQELLLH